MTFDLPTNAFELVRLIVDSYGIWIAMGGLKQARADIAEADVMPTETLNGRAERAHRLIRMRGVARRHAGYLAVLLLLAANALIAASTYNGGGADSPLQVSTNVAQIVAAIVIVRLSEMDTVDRLALLSVRSAIGDEVDPVRE